MKRSIAALFAVTAFALLSFGFAQVATVELLGVGPTSPSSPEFTAWSSDGSVGEVTVEVQALDASGAPVAGAHVTWRVQNSKPEIVWVVDMSGPGLGASSKPVSDSADRTFDGGTTDANGIAYIVLDSMNSADARVHVEVDGVEGSTYSGGPMRIVWF